MQASWRKSDACNVRATLLNPRLDTKHAISKLYSSRAGPCSRLMHPPPHTTIVRNFSVLPSSPHILLTPIQTHIAPCLPTFLNSTTYENRIPISRFRHTTYRTQPPLFPTFYTSFFSSHSPLSYTTLFYHPPSHKYS